MFEPTEIIVVNHPVYPPDLAFLDFCLFGEKKRLLSDRINKRSIWPVITEMLAPITKEGAEIVFSIFHGKIISLSGYGNFYKEIISWNIFLSIWKTPEIEANPIILSFSKSPLRFLFYNI